MFDYIKFNILNMRSPELIQKMKLKDLSDKINTNKYKFINVKLNALSVDCASFVYDLYKPLYNILTRLKEDLNAKDQSALIKFITESTFSEEQKELVSAFEKEAISARIKGGEQITKVFADLKNRFKKLQKSVSQEQAKSVNNIYNALKSLSELADFDFYMFLKFFAPNLQEGNFSKAPIFKPSSSVQAVDDLIKLDSGINSIIVSEALIKALKTYQEYKEIPPMQDKMLKSVLIKIKHLQKTDLLSDVVKYMLKDFLYKTIINATNTNIYIVYIASITEALKSNMEGTVKDIKNDKIAEVRNKMFNGISIIPLENLSDEFNSSLEKFELPVIEAIEPLEYLQTFVVEIYTKSIRKEENEICVSAEFTNKQKQQANMDAYYYLNSAFEKIQKLDELYSPATSDGKKLRLWLASKSKAMSNMAMIEQTIKHINDEAAMIIVGSFNAIVDMSTVLKNILDDVKTGSSKTVSNGGNLTQIGTINFDKIEETLPQIDNFINLMKYFIR